MTIAINALRLVVNPDEGSIRRGGLTLKGVRGTNRLTSTPGKGIEFYQ